MITSDNPTTHMILRKPQIIELMDKLDHKATNAETEAIAKRRAALPHLREQGEAAAKRARELRDHIRQLAALIH